MKNLVIASSELFEIELESFKNIESTNDYVSAILESKFFESNYPQGQILLGDIDTSDILLKDTNQNEINNLLKDKELEIFKISSLTPDKFLPLDIKSIDYLVLHGYALNSCANDFNHKLYKLSNQAKFSLSNIFFIDDNNTNQRLTIEKEVSLLYQEMLEYKIDFISDDLIDFIIKKNIKNLEIGWFPLSENDYQKIAALELDALYLSSTYNQKIKILPKKISELSIVCNIVNSLEDINFQKLKLSYLNLEGNSIKDPIYLNKFYSKIEYLNLKNNLITTVDFSSLNKRLENLDLSSNQITNENLVITEPCNYITYLDLSYNKLKVNLDFLFKLDSYFPNLEYVDLSGNEFMDTFGQSVLASMVSENQIQAIKDYLDIIEYFQDSSFDDIKDDINKYDNKYYSKLQWKIKNSSTELLIKEIQYHLENYLKFLKEDEYNFFAEGVYINLYNKKLSILLTNNNDTIALEIFSCEESIIKDYFFKYLQLVFEIIFDVTHKNILPTLETSNNLLDLHDFFRKVYRIDAKLKQKKSAAYLVELNSKTNKYTLLLNETQDYHDTRVDIDKVMFVIISSKSVIVYYLTEDNTISNYVLDKNDKRLNSLIIRTADDKEKYKRTLLNPYLSNNPFQDIDAYVDGEIKKKFNLIINPFYINQIEDEPGVLYLNTDSYKIDPNNRNTEHSSIVNISNNELLFVSKD